MIKRMSMMACSVAALALTAGCSLGANIGIDPTNPSASPASSGITVDGTVVANLPNPLEIATATGLKASACAEEKNLKSSSGASTNIRFKNSSSALIRIYWLDHTGKRVEYINGRQAANGNGGLAAGGSFDQQTFVTHPWVITTANGDCLGIYTPTDTSNVTLDITKTVNITSSGSSSSSATSGSGSVTAGSASEARVRQSIECLKAKGKTAEAGAVQASLNLYLEAQKQGGIATLLGNAHLQQATTIAGQHGC